MNTGTGPSETRQRNSWKRWLGLLIIVSLLAANRYRILLGVGSFLITEDELVHADAVYVLGGAPRERGARGAELVQQGHAGIMVCTGSNIPGILEGEGLMLTEAELSRRSALRAGLDSARIRPLVAGTSTWEEAALIRDDARVHGYDTILIVSTEFHLRRVGRVFAKQVRDTPIEVRTISAAGLNYDPKRWWTSEEGLLMVNNEHVKLIYYWITY